MRLQKDFPLLLNQPQLVYLDSAATSLKPQSVIDSNMAYYTQYTANIHRGLYQNAIRTDKAYETARHEIANFIGAKAKEVIFTRNSTESANLLAYTLIPQISPQDEIVTTVMEHHSNLIPWQILAKKIPLSIKYVDITNSGYLNQEHLFSLLSSHTKIVSLAHISNVLGTINPIDKLVAGIRHLAPQALIAIDGAQAVPHLPVNVASLGCDFYFFSSHKMLGPTGIGILWGREALLNSLPPFLTGGGMIKKVTLENTTFADIPDKFEAGTPHIAGAIGLTAAVQYLSQIGMDKVRSHETELTAYTLELLATLPEITIYGPPSPKDRAGVVSFNLAGIHPHDLAQVLSDSNIAIRAGHHCAMPLHERLATPATARVSFYVYNDKRDVDQLFTCLKKAQKLFRQ